MNQRSSHLGRVVLVASGKGGVGKSTVAANLAVGLQKAGSTVGLLDADFHGPSQAEMFNARTPPRIVSGKIEPVHRFGVMLLSSGMLGPRAKAFAWRGPLLRGVLRQFLYDASWDSPDYLVVDLPPGTGETLVALLKYVAPRGVVIVTTPQEVACADTRRSMSMFQQLGIPILALVENMSNYRCPKCGASTRIFPGDGGARLAAEYSVIKFVDIPLCSGVALSGDKGTPLLATDIVEDPLTAIFTSLVQTITLATRVVDEPVGCRQ